MNPDTMEPPGPGDDWQRPDPPAQHENPSPILLLRGQVLTFMNTLTYETRTFKIDKRNQRSVFVLKFGSKWMKIGTMTQGQDKEVVFVPTSAEKPAVLFRFVWNHGQDLPDNVRTYL